MAVFTLTAVPRDPGKGASRRLRAAGQVPAVLYGPGIESEALAVDQQLLAKVYEKAGSAHLVEVEIQGRPDRHTVLIKDLSRHPVRGSFEHADLYRVPMDRPVVSRVPVRFEGRDRRPNDGGIISEIVHAVEVKSLPQRIPEAVLADLSGLTLGQSLHVRDLQVPEGVVILDSPDEVVVSVLEPSKPAAEAAEAEAEERAAKPEPGEQPEA
ncbi:50S ribosomal protein L25 [Limnochorda pilosa]|uniref:Large ribosomal subunit protein bL25 n=1 Tax=Limnochorda pilosa TaxID=1555112 RepID=A0A0K2SQM4_LIMPI|nr:50S ribosomal protein L25 [Limnochorda pilosa]BAS29406.1 50S ribosomal protein L25 [Limnochorda pilosa]